jgi:hypothetical protein
MRLGAATRNFVRVRSRRWLVEDEPAIDGLRADAAELPPICWVPRWTVRVSSEVRLKRHVIQPAYHLDVNFVGRAAQLS